MFSFKAKTHALNRLIAGTFILTALTTSNYSLATEASCPELSSVKAHDNNGVYEYSSGNWKGSNAETDAEPQNVNYAETKGVKFKEVTLAQRKVGTYGEDDGDVPGSIISFVKCDYVGTGTNERVRLSTRTSSMATPAASSSATWADEKPTQTGDNKNSAGTVNKSCEANSPDECTFNLN